MGVLKRRTLYEPGSRGGLPGNAAFGISIWCNIFISTMQVFPPLDIPNRARSSRGTACSTRLNRGPRLPENFPKAHLLTSSQGRSSGRLLYNARYTLHVRNASTDPLVALHAACGPRGSRTELSPEPPGSGG